MTHPQTIDSGLRGSRMDCGFYQTFMGYTIEGNREAHKFSLSNAFKDLTYLEAMADAATTILRDRALWSEMSVAAAADARARFSTDDIVSRYEAFYERTLE